MCWRCATQAFKDAAFVALARRHGIAVCLALSDDYPLIADPTADFVYMRLQTSTAEHDAGYEGEAIARFAAQARQFADGGMPADLPTLAPVPASWGRECFVYFISGAKERNPVAAQALLTALR